MVETHIRLLESQLHLMEDEFPEASIDELVEYCVAVKVRRQTLGGYSPSQWWFGTQFSLKVQENGLGENRQVSNDDWSVRQLPRQPLFLPTDARKTLRMAQYARSRVMRNRTVGHLESRRSKGGVGGGRDRGFGGRMVLLGPARVLAIQQPFEVE